MLDELVLKNQAAGTSFPNLVFQKLVTDYKQPGCRKAEAGLYAQALLNTLK